VRHPRHPRAIPLSRSAPRYGDLRRAARIAGPGSTGTADILTWRFDVAYYSAILSFLGIHYSHDHFLFTDFEALAPARSR